MYCSECGAQLAELAKFCSRCGSQVSTAQTNSTPRTHSTYPSLETMATSPAIKDEPFEAQADRGGEGGRSPDAGPSVSKSPKGKKLLLALAVTVAVALVATILAIVRNGSSNAAGGTQVPPAVPTPSAPAPIASGSTSTTRAASKTITYMIDTGDNSQVGIVYLGKEGSANSALARGSWKMSFKIPVDNYRYLAVSGIADGTIVNCTISIDGEVVANKFDADDVDCEHKMKPTE